MSFMVIAGLLCLVVAFSVGTGILVSSVIHGVSIVPKTEQQKLLVTVFVLAYMTGWFNIVAGLQVLVLREIWRLL